MVNLDTNNVVKLRESGCTYQEIADLYNCTRQHIGFILKKLGKNKKTWVSKTNQEKQISEEKRMKRWGKLKLSAEDRKISRALITARQRAYTKGLDFNLKPIDLQPLPNICPVLGIPLIYNGTAKGCRDGYATLDRVDNNLGYVKGNVIIISWKANIFKAHGTAEDHRAIANYIDKHTK